MDGMFAAGDIRAGSMKRVAAAVGEGSSAIQSVHQYLTQLPEASDTRLAARLGLRPGGGSS